MPATAKRIIFAIIVLLVAGGGIIMGLRLIRERQELREEAAVPGGQAQASLSPETGSFGVGDTFPISVYFNTANIPISGISVRLTYPYSGTTPEYVASDIEINSVLLSSGDWTCPTRNVSAEGGTVNIDIACANISASGFSNSSNTLLATFDFTIERTPLIDPMTLRFDPSMSIVTRKSDGQDILLIPTSTGEYTVSGATGPTATPTPTISSQATPTQAPTSTVTPTPTTRLSPTPTSTGSATLTPTTTTKGGQELPDAGVSYPTIFGIFIGILSILGAFVLIL